MSKRERECERKREVDGVCVREREKVRKSERVRKM